MVVRYFETFCVIFCFISSISLRNDVVPFDVGYFTRRKFVFPVLLCRNIQPFIYKCPCIDVGMCVSLVLEEVKDFSIFNALLVSSSSFYPV